MSNGIGWVLALLQVSMKLYYHYFYTGVVIRADLLSPTTAKHQELTTLSGGPDEESGVHFSHRASPEVPFSTTLLEERPINSGLYSDGEEYPTRLRAPTLLDTVSAILAPLDLYLPDEVIAEEAILDKIESVATDVESRAERSTSIWGAGSGAPAEGPVEVAESPGYISVPLDPHDYGSDSIGVQEGPRLRSSTVHESVFAHGDFCS